MLLLCIVCEFGIGIVQHAHYLVSTMHTTNSLHSWNAQCTNKYTWILTNVLSFSLSASKCAHTLHYVWIRNQHFVHAHYSMFTLHITCCFFWVQIMHGNKKDEIIFSLQIFIHKASMSEDKVMQMSKISFENVLTIKLFKILLKNNYANDVNKMMCHHI